MQWYDTDVTSRKYFASYGVLRVLGRRIFEHVSNLVVINSHSILPQGWQEFFHHGLPNEPTQVLLHRFGFRVDAKRFEKLGRIPDLAQPVLFLILMLPLVWVVIGHANNGVQTFHRRHCYTLVRGLVLPKERYRLALVRLVPRCVHVKTNPTLRCVIIVPVREPAQTEGNLLALTKERCNRNGMVSFPCCDKAPTLLRLQVYSRAIART